MKKLVDTNNKTKIQNPQNNGDNNNYTGVTSLHLLMTVATRNEDKEHHNEGVNRVVMETCCPERKFLV